MSTQKIITAAFILMAVLSFSGCKKDTTDKNQPDQSVYLKNKIWTGEENYPGKKAEPVMISFMDGGVLSWAELGGEYTGTWQLDKGVLTISVSGSVSFKANISTDNQLTNIKSTDAAGRTLNNAALNETLDQALDNTIWKSTSIIMQFKAGSKVDLVLGTTSFPNMTYTRKGKSIRFSPVSAYQWFLVTNSSSTMKGASIFSPNPNVDAFTVTRL